MRRTVAGWLGLAVILLGTPTVAHAGTGDCGRVTISCGVDADPTAGVFHGVVAATDAGWVLSEASHGGTTPGCGDCVWHLTLACPQADPADPAGTNCSGAAGAGICPAGQLLYRLYLTTRAVTDEAVGQLCLGGPGAQIVPVGDQARADVARYMQDATPPPLRITIAPNRLTLTGLSTRFTAAVPAGLSPTEFGGPTVTETITLALLRIRWRWGDASTSGWLPDSTVGTHVYLEAGSRTARLSARWGASYTVGYAGQVFGPYDAIGELSRSQARNLRVATSNPVLVSRN